MRQPQYILDEEKIDDSVNYLVVTKAFLEQLTNNPKIASREPEILYEFSDKIQGNFVLVKLKKPEQNSVSYSMAVSAGLPVR